MDRETNTSDLTIGSELRGRMRLMTRERMRWYVDAQPTVGMDTGRIERQEPTIHDDDGYARSQGLPGIIADGMISTNWILGLLVHQFGDTVAREGALRTKYVKPIYEDDAITSCARVTAIDHQEGGRRVKLDVWCENGEGTVVTVGDATVVLR
ncbi:Acyl dehydratase [Faunimonas pinastri]|uniref:Acyl dehydratase n=1 Tax=Faunimonas pinastri TaxID=1855383 RepID=A0A1H9ECL5_9HYPH|nr:MaoC family dehydratase [Faunimonas pinastri]SEQ23440.1 Acyl dehydratase [Faunimonas pinastri]